MDVSWTAAEQIANAVLYEGYLLYPYRPSALKNRQRWTFGVLYPEAFARHQAGHDRFSSQTECLLEYDGDARLAAKVRFLQSVGGEIVEREVILDDLLVAGPAAGAAIRFSFPPIDGGVEIESAPVVEGLWRVTLRIVNHTPFGSGDRDDAIPASLLSCHVVLATEHGRFVSLTDPPPAWAGHAEACVNLGMWPVLIGDPGGPGLLLASPIILPDYPGIAPESAGDFFDGTEIDELLSLRVLTLTDAEKDEMRRADDRAEQLLDRTESLSTDDLLAMHGTWRRGAAQRRLQPGQRVRLQPAGRGDILDLVLRGREATIVAVETDLEGRTYLAVTIDSDPGSDLGRQGHPGHRFFFAPDDVEPL